VARSPLDRITLSHIKLVSRIGVTEAERELPQACEADVTVWGDFEAAASTDGIDKAIDYGSVLAAVVAIASEREYNLLETLAYRVARQLLQAFPADRVGVRVRKRPATLAGQLDYVEVEIEES
jgi:7,8-dihydroneopterin aldolase/epimerase/oxygenase